MKSLKEKGCMYVKCRDVETYLFYYLITENNYDQSDSYYEKLSRYNKRKEKYRLILRKSTYVYMLLISMRINTYRHYKSYTLQIL